MLQKRPGHITSICRLWDVPRVSALAYPIDFYSRELKVFEFDHVDNRSFQKWFGDDVETLQKASMCILW